MEPNLDEDGHVEDIFAIPDGERIEKLKTIAGGGDVNVRVTSVGNGRLDRE